jgi:hypothetical protein
MKWVPTQVAYDITSLPKREVSRELYWRSRTEVVTAVGHLILGRSEQVVDAFCGKL